MTMTNFNSGKMKVQECETPSTETDKEQLVCGVIRDWHLMVGGAIVVLGILAGAYKIGLFEFRERIAVTESRVGAVERTTTSLDHKLDELGKKVDNGFARLQDKIDVLIAADRTVRIAPK